MRRFEYGRIQSLSWDMDMLSLIAGFIGQMARRRFCFLRVLRCWSLLWSWQSAEYGGFECD